ncbi:MAG: T9SS type A sorting domain-containing protein [Bacteroidota bacterium]
MRIGKTLLRNAPCVALRSTATLALIVLLISGGSRASAQQFIVTEPVAGTIQSGNTDGSGPIHDLVTGLQSAYGLAFDGSKGAVYWSDFAGKKISRFDITTNVMTTVVSPDSAGLQIPRGVALDQAREVLYWADNGTGKIQSTRLDSLAVTDIVDTGLASPSFLAFDPSGRGLYCADNGTNAKRIIRCDPDGANYQIVVSNLGQVRGIAIDTLQKYIYWIDSGTMLLERASLAGTFPTKSDTAFAVAVTVGSRGLAIDQSTRRAYWTDVAMGTISSMSLDSTTVRTIASGLTTPLGIALNLSAPLNSVAGENSSPLNFRLFANYPNPFNPSTVISGQLTVDSWAKLEVYDVLGRVVATLVDRRLHAGKFSYTFDARALASGMYFYRLEAEGNVTVKKMMLLK